MEKTWLPVEVAPGYEVSNAGEVRSVNRVVPEIGTSRVCFRNGKILKPWIDTRGYLSVQLQVDRKTKTFSVHRLVTAAFHGPSNGLHVRHLDGNKLNNTPENLRWGTPQENADDKVRHGTMPRGATHWRAKQRESSRSYHDAGFVDFDLL